MGQFSATLMDHFDSPRNAGQMDAPTVSAMATLQGRAPRLTLQLRIDGGRIVDARFSAFGCGVTIACGSMLTEMVNGRPLADCRKLTAGALIRSLDGIPPEKRFCANLAIDSLKLALLEHERQSEAGAN